MNSIRRAKIISDLSKVGRLLPDSEFSDILKLVLRNSNYQNEIVEGKFHMEVTDESLSMVIEKTLKELEDE